MCCCSKSTGAHNVACEAIGAISKVSYISSFSPKTKLTTRTFSLGDSLTRYAIDPRQKKDVDLFISYVIKVL